MKRKAMSQKVSEEEEEKKKRQESTETFAEKAEIPCVGESTKSSESPDEEDSAENFEEQTGVPDEDGSAERFEGRIEVPGEQGSFTEIMEEKARVSVGMGSTETCGLPNEAKSTESLEEEVRFPARFILDNMSCMQEGPREVFETDCTASKHAESALDKKISCEDAQSNVMEVKCLSSDLVAATPQPLLGHNTKGEMSTCGSVMESFRVGSDRDCAAQDQTVESSGLESKERTESEDEDEDDIDFNPFLLHSPSPEASSGLSSESEDLEEENEMAVGHILKEHEGAGFLETERKTCVELGSEEENEEVDDSEAEENDNNDEDHADKSASEDRSFQGSIHAEHHFGVEHCFGVSTEPFEVSSASQRDCCAATVILDGGYEPNSSDEESLRFGRRHLQHTASLSFLDKAAVTEPEHEGMAKANPWRLCTVTQVEEVKLLFRIVPIWMATFAYGLVFAQVTTFFTKQGATMDRQMGKHFTIPAASVQSFTTVVVIVLLPIYDRVFVPFARRLTGNERGISLLQRIGVGLFLSIVSIVVAAIIEGKRLRAASHAGLLQNPKAIIPLSISWLLPQYALMGISDVFVTVGLQEFFYDQMPDGLRSLGMAFYLCASGMGGFLSSILITVVQNVTSHGGKDPGWIANNLNRSHIDYFYWLLVVVSSINLLAFIIISHFYTYKKTQSQLVTSKASHELKVQHHYLNESA